MNHGEEVARARDLTEYKSMERILWTLKTRPWAQSATFIAVIFCFALSGCAPGLSTTLPVHDIPTSDSAPKNLSGVRAKVDAFQDQRATDRIARVNGRDVRPEGDVGVSVQQAIERQLKVQGARLALFNAPTFRGTVEEWHISVKPGFPSSTAKAVAKIAVDLVDAKGKKLSNGTYKGVMEAENPMLSEDKISSILGSAMLQAIQHMLSDPRFLSKLRDASAGAVPDEIIAGEEEGEGPSRIPVEPQPEVENEDPAPTLPPAGDEERLPQLREAPYQAEPNERY